VLIVLADQMGKSVGDLYKGAFIPGFALMGLYILWVAILAFFKPAMVPALPPEARTFREPERQVGLPVTAVLAVLSTVVAVALAQNMEAVHSWWQGKKRTDGDPADEKIVVAMCGRQLRCLAGGRDQPHHAHGVAVEAGRARHLRADSAVAAHLPGAGHHLPGRGHADRGRRHGAPWAP
jgi:hypothetical protein